MELGKRNLLTVAVVSAVVAVVSIVGATIWGELPEVAWFAFIVGFFGGGLTFLVSLGILVAKRLRAERTA